MHLMTAVAALWTFTLVPRAGGGDWLRLLLLRVTLDGGIVGHHATVARFRFATDLFPERRALVAVTCYSCTVGEVSAASRGRGQRKGATATSVSIWSR